MTGKTGKNKPVKIRFTLACSRHALSTRACQCTHSVYTVYTQCTHGNNLTTSALVQAGTVRRYRLNARRMATPCIGSSASSSEFSTWMFLPGQICPIFENLMTFLKVPGRFSTSWNSESLRKLDSYTIMGTLPSIYSCIFAICQNHRRRRQKRQPP